MQAQPTAVSRKVSEDLLLSLKRCRELIPRALRLMKPVSISKKRVALVLETNRALAEEGLQGADVIREPFSLVA